MAEIKIKARTTLRHDTAKNWVSANPVLLNGEVGIESDTNLIKIGDGVTHWNDLNYIYNSISVDELSGVFD